MALSGLDEFRLAEIEAAAKRFINDSDSDDEESGVGSSTQKKGGGLGADGLSSRQIKKFEKAFHHVAGHGVTSIPLEKVSAVFGSYGENVDDGDLDAILKHCLTDAMERYSCDVLMSAYDYWRLKEKNLDPDNLREDSLGFGLTRNQEFELNMAFRVVAGEGVEVISEEQIDDVFMALGYTLQPADLDVIISNCVTDNDGNYSYSGLVEGYNFWRRKQLNLTDLSPIFNALVKEGKLPRNFPRHLTNKLAGDSMVGVEGVRNALNAVLHLEGDLEATDHDALGLIDEVASTPQRAINFTDFLDMFRV